MTAATRIRLDTLLAESHGYKSRSRARDAIQRACVKVDGKIETKPSLPVAPESQILIDDPAQNYVSRAALKLIHALDLCGLDVRGKLALDLGASTGGFTQVLLERGVRKVFAIDVGSGQMDPALAGDSRVKNIENLNARDLAPDHLESTAPDVIVSDLSFISLKIALPPALGLAATGATGIFLIKPQFEVGREHVGRGGIVRNRDKGLESAQSICGWLGEETGWEVLEFTESPIEGGDGNTEYLVVARKMAGAAYD